jgi:hypothetical protein
MNAIVAGSLEIGSKRQGAVQSKEVIMPITRRTLIWVGMASVLLAGVRTSHAQIGYQAASLEWLVADSDVVVRATVVDVSREPANGLDRVRVTVDVHETVKGRPTKRLKFDAYAAPEVKTFEELKETGQESLLFLVRAERHPFKAEVRGDGVDVATELEPHEVSEWQWDQSIVRLGPPAAKQRLTLPIFTVDLRLLTIPDEVLQAARAAVVEGGKAERVRFHEVHLFYDVMRVTGKSGDANILYVPIDGRLEAAARAWIKSPGDILRRLGIARPEGINHRWSLTDPLRSEGVRALRHFKSDENIVILKGLLDDDAFSHRKVEKGEQDGISEKVYYIRKEAFETLRGWGVEVNEPVLKEWLPQK